MYFSGIADEAGQPIARQIAAHRELGWSHIELRQIDGVCVTDLEDAVFDQVAEQLSAAGLTVSCFASQLANWARPIDGDFAVDEQELRRAIPRMKRMGTRWIRCMSYPNCTPPLPESDWRSEVVDRMRRLTAIAADGDVVLVHENCHGWAGEGAAQAVKLLEAVDSPHLKLVFDTGNPICLGQNAWDLYQAVADHIVYVHIKDYKAQRQPVRGEEDLVASFPGEGDCTVRTIVADLLASGYDGGFSIEPHINSVIHLSQQTDDPELAYSTYIDYGRKLEAMVRELQTAAF